MKKFEDLKMVSIPVGDIPENAKKYELIKADMLKSNCTKESGSE